MNESRSKVNHDQLFEKRIPLLLALHKNDDYDNKKQVTPWDKNK